MKMIPLGKSGIDVSEICLGTMTWGTQNTQAEAHAQADLALDHGVSFWDTAEMYPTNPAREEAVGVTEEYIGNWFEARGAAVRDKIQLATKVTGEGGKARGGAEITGAVMREAVEGSLRRLKTDRIDLYQLHWPNRGSYHFRQMWTYAPTGIDKAAVTAHMTEVLVTAQALIAEGKIRAIGVSNESVWGMARWLHLADSLGLPRMVSVQNEYSPLCRQFDTDWAELSLIEDVPLLAYSPLATGLLTGKYAGDVTPEGTRRAATPDLGGRISPRVFPAVAAWLGLAARHGVDPARLAIAFCLSRPFRTIPIVGATSLEQLSNVLAAPALELSEALLLDIADWHREHPQPY